MFCGGSKIENYLLNLDEINVLSVIRIFNIVWEVFFDFISFGEWIDSSSWLSLSLQCHGSCGGECRG